MMPGIVGVGEKPGQQDAGTFQSVWTYRQTMFGHSWQKVDHVILVQGPEIGRYSEFGKLELLNLLFVDKS